MADSPPISSLLGVAAPCKTSVVSIPVTGHGVMLCVWIDDPSVASEGGLQSSEVALPAEGQATDGSRSSDRYGVGAVCAAWLSDKAWTIPSSWSR